MKKTRIMTLGISCALFAAVGAVSLVGCGAPVDAKALYEAKCSTCHSLGTVDNASYTGTDQWKSSVNRMKAMTTTISDDDAAKITEYLASR